MGQAPCQAVDSAMNKTALPMRNCIVKPWEKKQTMVPIRKGSILVSCNLKTGDKVPELVQWPRNVTDVPGSYYLFAPPFLAHPQVYPIVARWTLQLTSRHVKRKKTEQQGTCTELLNWQAPWVPLGNSPGSCTHQLPFASHGPLLAARELGNRESLVGTRRQWIMTGNRMSQTQGSCNLGVEAST